MTSHQPTILIIGGPDKANCYSEGDITRVAHHPLDVLRLRHLYDYDAVIFWPSTLSPADWTFNLTKGELRKEFSNYFSTRSSKKANNNECGPSVTDKTPHSVRKQTRKMSLKPKDFISNNLSLVIDYYINSTDKPSTSLMAAVLGYPRLLYVVVPTWLIQDMLRPSSLFKKSSQNNDDSHILVDDDDKKQILKWYDKKLYDIVCGVANRQLAFYIAPNIENSGQNIEILNWIHFPVKVESDPVIKFYFSQPPEPSKHSILSILSELGSIIKEWKYVFIPPQNSSFSLENLIFWYGKPLHKKLSIGTYHTDGEGRPRSLMILSEKGGLALIPEPKSIDDLVGLIRKSLIKTTIAPTDSVDTEKVEPAKSTEKGVFAVIKEPKSIDPTNGIDDDKLDDACNAATVSSPTSNEIPDVTPNISIKENRRFKDGIEKWLKKKGQTNPLVGDSPAILQHIYPHLHRIMQNPLYTILIDGEIGSGKEVLCDLLANFSKNPEYLKRFNVAGLASNTNLMASGLFGMEKGVATGVLPQDGYIRAAQDGTLVLDGMERSTLEFQSLLLRVLDPDKREFAPIGSTSVLQAQCRFILCFNTTPKELINDKKLILDLLKRCPIHIRIPPLRERREDIPLLIEHFAKKYYAEKQPPGINYQDICPPPEKAAEWQNKSWANEDGNVRGLKQAIDEYMDFRTSELQDNKRQNLAKRGRKPGRDIEDQTLADILKKCANSKQTIDDVFNAINSSLEPGKEFASTSDNLRQRISRIESDQLKVEAKKHLDNIPGFYKRLSKSSDP